MGNFRNMLCAIRYYLYNLKNVKDTHGGVLLLVKLQVKSLSGHVNYFVHVSAFKAMWYLVLIPQETHDIPVIPKHYLSHMNHDAINTVNKYNCKIGTNQNILFLFSGQITSLLFVGRISKGLILVYLILN